MSKMSKVNHAAGIFADMSVDGPPIGTLIAIIDRAKNLPNRKTMGKQNPYCAARLGKEAKKTPTDLRGGQTPRWDHELRFTVHESPDYYKLKVSVFNDDKKTDLIGETWVDLQNLIIPGGSQDDHWHSLQCRGKYSGDIRIEMTYYDTRQQDEVVIGKRKEAAERAQGKAPTTSSSSLSGPRQLIQVKRRPLPTDPSGATPPRPMPVEKPQSAPPAPLQQPVPSRPALRQQANSVAQVDSLSPQAPLRQPEAAYDTASYESQPPVMHSRGYETHDNYQPEWDAPAPAAPALPPAGMMRRNTHEIPYQDLPYDTRPLQPRSQSDYEQPPSRDYRSTSEPPYEADLTGRPVYDEPVHPQDAYSLVSPQYAANPMTYGPVSTFNPRHQAHVDDPMPSDYSRPSSSSGPMDDPRYMSQNIRALQPVRRRDDYHPEYATMQPRVEDEDEDGPPPPPPAHRSRMAQPMPSQQPVSQAVSPYKPYTPSHSPNASPMPPSLVAGYESEDAIERQVIGDRVRRPSNHVDDEMMITQQPSPASLRSNTREPSPYDAPVYPLRTSPKPLDDRASISSRDFANTETRMVTRKSVSPRPSSSDSRGGSSIPFSPDSYNNFNPNASRSATGRDPVPVYDSPSQARDAAVRAEIEPVRDLSQPIIGDDGREIDPSDHLPTDTWAPEPERKNRKPEVIIRFKHSPRDRPTSRGNETASRSGGPPRVSFRPEVTTYGADRPSKRYTPTHVHSSSSLDRTPPPRMERGQDSYSGYSHGRGYSTPTSVERPRSSRGSVSPSPSSRSPLYDYNSGPPIPSKVPISPGAPSYPVTSSNPSSGNHGMDALSRELKTIDIGSVGCSPSRAVRKYAPTRASASIGYAS
ncbi:hypothetical protein PENSTE_c002G05997 [Penicillium steckii]|uniref:C2 domain-containing protein n=1 Tax=Penicillium steckii TaxID=303698 RepID=A0A1V6TUJ6_9EURO|nr:hypothetical protein PENSTE_c002G05997 [Penicillium steckii]